MARGEQVPGIRRAEAEAKGGAGPVPEGWCAAVREGERWSGAGAGGWCAVMRGLQDVVAGVGVFWQGVRLGRDRAQAACLVVLERLDEFVPGVHHERAVRGHRLPDGLAAEQEDVQILARALLVGAGPEGD